MGAGAGRRPGENAARADAGQAQTGLVSASLMIEELKIELARLRRETYGTSSEKLARIEQLELQLENLEETHLAAWAGVLQADAYGGYNKLYEPGRSPAPITQALCWSHGRRHFFELADVAESARARASPPSSRPSRWEAVRRIDLIFDIEREING